MKVNIRETLERVVDVDSIEEAELLYRSGSVELTAEDLKDVEFTEYKEN